MLSLVDEEGALATAAAEAHSALAIGENEPVQKERGRAAEILLHRAASKKRASEKQFIYFLAATRYYYMVMTSLPWTMEACWPLWLPEEPGRRREKHREEKRTVLKMKFKQLVQAFITLPCQVVRTKRRLVYRLIS